MDEAMLKSGQYPNIAIEAGTDPAEVMREHGRTGEGAGHMDNGVSVQMCPNDTGAHSNVSQNLSDTREQLEADVKETIDFWGAAYPDARVRMVLSWLDRQAAITEREIAERREEYGKLPCGGTDCMELVNELQAKRDELEKELKHERAEWEPERDYANQCEERVKELTAERDRLQAKVDELNASWRKANDGWAEANAEAERWRQKRDQLSRDLDAEHALVVQFEHDNEELRHANNTLRASVAGLKMTVERFKARESQKPADMGN